MKEKLAACDNNEEECEAAYDHTSGTRKDGGQVNVGTAGSGGVARPGGATSAGGASLRS